MAHDHDHSDHGGHDHEGHGHSHGHENDKGLAAMARYARHARSMWRSEVNQAVVDLVGPAAGETVIDIGAGVGAGTVLAARSGATVVALEPTSYMRRILGLRRLAQRSRANIQVVDGAAEAMGVADASADAAWAVNTMHHWTDIQAGTAELGRVLAPGGRVVLADEDFDDPTHPEYEKFKERHDGSSHPFHMVDPTTISEALSAAGLEVDRAESTQVVGRPVILIEAHKPSDRTEPGA